MTTRRPLEGIKVLDLTRVLAGPYCTMVLGDLGADVVKVEVPDTGDDARHFGPFVGTESAYFMSLNRNKRSVTLNLKDERAKGLLLRLVRHFDVLAENFRPGTMEKLGLGYERLAEENPQLVYAATSGLGNTGPYRLKPAYDVVVQGMGGIMSITGQPGGLPTRVGASIGDITAGLFTAIGILAALRARERTGLGQMVDVAMLDGQVAILENAIARYEVSGAAPEPIGNRHPSITPFTSVAASDGHLIIAVGNDALWGKFCRVIGRPNLVEHPAYRTNHDRTENWESLEPLLNEAFRERTVAEWLEALEAAGIPCGPINTVDQVVSDPQVAAREMIVEADHPVAGRVKMAGSPIKLSGAPRQVVRSPSPTLGQHTRQILQETLGLSAAEIDGLAEAGAI
jgi:CoA:oxalate CoA-transferase